MEHARQMTCDEQRHCVWTESLTYSTADFLQGGPFQRFRICTGKRSPAVPATPGVRCVPTATPRIVANRYFIRFWEPSASLIFNPLPVDRVLSLRWHDSIPARACSHYSTRGSVDTLAAHSEAHRKNHSARKLLTAFAQIVGS